MIEVLCSYNVEVLNCVRMYVCSGKWDYELYLRYDLYTNKHTQWFYFSVANVRQEQTYRFTIVNLYKVSYILHSLPCFLER